MAETSNYSQGGDAQAISRIVKSYYGSYRKMFDAHGWNEPDGKKLMISAPALIVGEYGSIQRFEELRKPNVMNSGQIFWTDQTSVIFTSFWGWTPETWGTVGFTGDRGQTRRANLLKELSDPFICVCYVTSNKTYIDPKLKGMIAGFYLVSHETGDRDEFTDPIHHGRDSEKWRHSLKATRAFSYLPEYRLSVRDFDPAMLKKARSVSAMGEIITDRVKIMRLRERPWIEVDVYSQDQSESLADATQPGKGKVRAGPASKSGYEVSQGTHHLPRELYVLRLSGDADSYLGKSAKGRSIYKIGLSVSPDLRRQSFQKSMPCGAFIWKIERRSRDVGFGVIQSFDSAVAGENAMKEYLKTCADWLGGEFYLAHQSEIDAAWQAGHDAANSFAMKGLSQHD